MNIKTAGIAAGIAALALTGCGGGGSDDASSPLPTDAPAPVAEVDSDMPETELEATAPAPNPVAYAKDVPGCILPKGAKSGDMGADGERVVTCKIYAPGEPHSEESSYNLVTVTTLPDPNPWQGEPSYSEDGNTTIEGDCLNVVVTAYGENEYAVSPEKIAKAVGGKVMPPRP